MKKRKWIAAVLPLCFVMTGCTQNDLPNGELKICIDGIGFDNIDAMVAEFEKQYPEISLTVEILPQVETHYEMGGTPVLDTDSLTQREAVLQQHRTALMAGSSEADLYLITGGLIQSYEFNGGTFIQDPVSLMHNGVLADLSGVTQSISIDDYFEGVFEPGIVENTQYIIPLRSAFDGFVFNQAQDPGFSSSAEEFVQTVADVYAEEFAELYTGIMMPVRAVSYPIVNKASGTISISDEAYAAAFRQTEMLQEAISPHLDSENLDTLDTAQRIEQNKTILTTGPSPFLSLASVGQDLSRRQMKAAVGYTSCPNEKGGITAEINVFAFAPATCRNIPAANTFLAWMLSEDVQNNTTPVFSEMTTYPVRKGCIREMIAHSAMADSFKSLEESSYADVDAYESRINAAKFFTEHDRKLEDTLYEWRSGKKTMLECLQELEQYWQLYLDE